MVCKLMGGMSLFAATTLTPETHHSLGFWGSLGYYGMHHNAQSPKLISGATPSLGVGYRYFHNNFIFQTGIEGQFMYSGFSLPKQEIEQMMVDADDNREPFLMKITLSNLNDRYKQLSVNVPLYAGYEKNHLYILAGIAASVRLLGTATAQSVLSTKGEYDRFIGEFEQMPNHGLSTVSVKSEKFAMKTNLNVLLHFEAGGRLDKFRTKKGYYANTHSYRLYLGGFIDYGLLNGRESSYLGDQMTLDFTQGVQAKMVPLLLSNQMQGKSLHPFTVGVKLTVLFELKESGKSFIYDYKKVDRGYRKRGGTQIIEQ